MDYLKEFKSAIDEDKKKEELFIPLLDAVDQIKKVFDSHFKKSVLNVTEKHREKKFLFWSKKVTDLVEIRENVPILYFNIDRKDFYIKEPFVGVSISTNDESSDYRFLFLLNSKKSISIIPQSASIKKEKPVFTLHRWVSDSYYYKSDEISLAKFYSFFIRKYKANLVITPEEVK